MTSRWQSWLHRGMLAAGWGVGVLVITLAVLIALTQLLLPLVAQHPQWIAAQLSARAQRPVSFSAVEGRWTPSGPILLMHGVVVGAPAGQSAPPLRLPESELRLDFGGWLLPSRHFLNLRARGLQLDLSHERDGAWRINGIGVAGDTTRQSLTLGRLSVDLWLEDLRVQITEVGSNQHYTLLARQLRVSRQGSGRIRVGGALRRAGVATRLHVVGEFSDDGNSGRLWVALDDAQLQPLFAGVDLHGYRLDRGHGRLTAWLDWRDGKLLSAVMRLDVDALTVSALSTPGTDNRAVSLGAVHGLAGMRRGADGYRLRWAGDDESAAVAVVHEPETPQARVGVAARQLRMAQWLPLLALKPGLSPAVGNWLQRGRPHGLVSAANVRWSQTGGLQALQVAFAGLGIDPVGKLPGVRQLRGTVRGDAQALVMELPLQSSELDMPRLFRQPLALSKLGGTLAFWKQDDAWTLGMDALDFAGDGYAGQLRGELAFPAQGGLPVAAVYATLEHADVPAAKLFWPLGSMSPATMTWLDRALVAGTIDHAQVVLRGDLAQWPFREHAGRFEAHVPIRDLTLDYGVDWPRAEGVEVVADFVNNSMHAQARGQVLGVRADNVMADITDFSAAPLDLSVRGSGSGADVMQFVAQSPIGSAQVATLNKLKLGGTTTFALHLILPLHADGAAQLDGNAQLIAADLSAPEWNLNLGKITGPVRFNAHGVDASALHAAYRGKPAALAFAIGDVDGHADTTVWAQMQGAWSLGDLVADYPSLQWIGDASSGTSNFDIGYSLARGAGTPQRLTIDSNLKGSTLDLPLPLRKASAASLPLHVTLGLPIAGSDLQVAWGRAARARFRLADGTRPLAGVLAFGEQMPQDLPAQGLAIRGHADQLDVTGWVQRTVGGGDGGGSTLQGIHVATDQAAWFGRPLGAMQIDAVQQADTLKISVAGTAMAGTVVVPGDDLKRLGITARMQRLYWPKSVEASHGSPVEVPPTSAARAVVAAVPQDNPADTGIDPAALPPMHLWIGDLRLGESRLGDARLESWPTAQGMHIEQLRALSKDVQITASGDWIGSARDSHTHMRINFSAQDLGAMLGAFGFDGLVDGGKTHALIDANWPGSPTAFSLTTMDGTLGVKVDSGRIPEAASSGVGRLLGLVSLTELPRRLTLDFGDVFGKGLAFDSISGDFRLADGNATTDNLAIAGSSADISISGRTGLRARDYDQQLHVVPHVGNSLPLVGAVVGGPVGAAAGFAMQSLLGKGLNKAAGARYRITGSWEKPVMTLIEKHGVAVPPRPVAPADAGNPDASFTAAPRPDPLLPASPTTAQPAPGSSVH